MKTAIALGTFDGLHRGHRAVIEQTKPYYSIAVTFYVPPKSAMSGKPQLLILPKDREIRLKDLGVNQVVMQDFNDVRNIEASEYIEKLCEKYNITISDSERRNSGLLHAKLGAYLAYSKYDIEDQEIIAAITYHTTGRPEMTLLDKIVYIADYIEPNRNEAPNLPEVRKLAFVDIDECLYLILKDSLAYLQTKSEVIDPMTEQTYLYYKEVLKK